MINYIERKSKSFCYKIFCAILALTFVVSVVVPPRASYAQLAPPSGWMTGVGLPLPGAMVNLTSGFSPALIKGLEINPENPLQFNFIVNNGDDHLQGETLRLESTKLIKYFMAALTVPEDEQWVNLSPYEKDRIVPNAFGVTEMGRDLLAQDYMLKQLTASLVYPEDDLGKEFWNRVHKIAFEKYGTTDIPTNTFNKIWIVPEKAVVYEYQGTAYVVERHLKVMMEEDYAALAAQGAGNAASRAPLDQIQGRGTSVENGIASDIIREVLIPEIEKEVNEGKTFANLRQMYNSMILATWFKLNLQETILGKVYADKNKTVGIDVEDKQIKEKIYEQYLEAFKKGVYDFIKEEYDPASQEIIPRKYFSGGFDKAELVSLVGRDSKNITDFAALSQSQQQLLFRAVVAPGDTRDFAMTTSFVEAPNDEDFLAVARREGVVSRGEGFGLGRGGSAESEGRAEDKAMLDQQTFAAKIEAMRLERISDLVNLSKIKKILMEIFQLRIALLSEKSAKEEENLRKKLGNFQALRYMVYAALDREDDHLWKGFEQEVLETTDLNARVAELARVSNFNDKSEWFNVSEFIKTEALKQRLVSVLELQKRTIFGKEQGLEKPLEVARVAFQILDEVINLAQMEVEVSSDGAMLWMLEKTDTHTVVLEGDTLAHIAIEYGMKPADILMLNIGKQLDTALSDGEQVTVDLKSLEKQREAFQMAIEESGERELAFILEIMDNENPNVVSPGKGLLFALFLRRLASYPALEIWPGIQVGLTGYDYGSRDISLLKRKLGRVGARQMIDERLDRIRKQEEMALSFMFPDLFPASGQASKESILMAAKAISQRGDFEQLGEGLKAFVVAVVAGQLKPFVYEDSDEGRSLLDDHLNHDTRAIPGLIGQNSMIFFTQQSTKGVHWGHLDAHTGRPAFIFTPKFFQRDDSQSREVQFFEQGIKSVIIFSEAELPLDSAMTVTSRSSTVTTSLPNVDTALKIAGKITDGDWSRYHNEVAYVIGKILDQLPLGQKNLSRLAAVLLAQDLTLDFVGDFKGRTGQVLENAKFAVTIALNVRSMAETAGALQKKGQMELLREASFFEGRLFPGYLLYLLPKDMDLILSAVKAAGLGMDSVKVLIHGNNTSGFAQVVTLEELVKLNRKGEVKKIYFYDSADRAMTSTPADLAMSTGGKVFLILGVLAFGALALNLDWISNHVHARYVIHQIETGNDRLDYILNFIPPYGRTQEATSVYKEEFSKIPSWKLKALVETNIGKTGPEGAVAREALDQLFTLSSYGFSNVYDAIEILDEQLMANRIIQGDVDLLLNLKSKLRDHDVFRPKIFRIIHLVNVDELRKKGDKSSKSIIKILTKISQGDWAMMADEASRISREFFQGSGNEFVELSRNEPYRNEYNMYTKFQELVSQERDLNPASPDQNVLKNLAWQALGEAERDVQSGQFVKRVPHMDRFSERNDYVIRMRALPEGIRDADFAMTNRQVKFIIILSTVVFGALALYQDTAFNFIHSTYMGIRAETGDVSLEYVLEIMDNMAPDKATDIYSNAFLKIPSTQLASLINLNIGNTGQEGIAAQEALEDLFLLASKGFTNAYAAIQELDSRLIANQITQGDAVLLFRLKSILARYVIHRSKILEILGLVDRNRLAAQDTADSRYILEHLDEAMMAKDAAMIIIGPKEANSTAWQIAEENYGFPDPRTIAAANATVGDPDGLYRKVRLGDVLHIAGEENLKQWHRRQRERELLQQQRFLEKAAFFAMQLSRPLTFVDIAMMLESLRRDFAMTTALTDADDSVMTTKDKFNAALKSPETLSQAFDLAKTMWQFRTDREYSGGESAVRGYFRVVLNAALKEGKLSLAFDVLKDMWEKGGPEVSQDYPVYPDETLGKAYKAFFTQGDWKLLVDLVSYMNTLSYEKASGGDRYGKEKMKELFNDLKDNKQYREAFFVLRSMSYPGQEWSRVLMDFQLADMWLDLLKETRLAGQWDVYTEALTTLDRFLQEEKETKTFIKTGFDAHRRDTLDKEWFMTADGLLNDTSQWQKAFQWLQAMDKRKFSTTNNLYLPDLVFIRGAKSVGEFMDDLWLQLIPSLQKSNERFRWEPARQALKRMKERKWAAKDKDAKLAPFIRQIEKFVDFSRPQVLAGIRMEVDSYYTQIFVETVDGQSDGRVVIQLVYSEDNIKVAQAVKVKNIKSFLALSGITTPEQAVQAVQAGADVLLVSAIGQPLKNITDAIRKEAERLIRSVQIIVEMDTTDRTLTEIQALIDQADGDLVRGIALKPFFKQAGERTADEQLAFNRQVITWVRAEYPDMFLGGAGGINTGNFKQMLLEDVGLNFVGSEIAEPGGDARAWRAALEEARKVASDHAMGAEMSLELISSLLDQGELRVADEMWKTLNNYGFYKDQPIDGKSMISLYREKNQRSSVSGALSLAGVLLVGTAFPSFLQTYLLSWFDLKLLESPLTPQQIFTYLLMSVPSLYGSWRFSKDDRVLAGILALRLQKAEKKDKKDKAMTSASTETALAVAKFLQVHIWGKAEQEMKVKAAIGIIQRFLPENEQSAMRIKEVLEKQIETFDNGNLKKALEEEFGQGRSAQQVIRAVIEFVNIVEGIESMTKTVPVLRQRSGDRLAQFVSDSWLTRDVSTGHIISFKQEDAYTLMTMIEEAGIDANQVDILVSKSNSPFLPEVVSVANLIKLVSKDRLGFFYMYIPNEVWNRTPQQKPVRTPSEKLNTALVIAEETSFGASSGKLKKLAFVFRKLMSVRQIAENDLIQLVGVLKGEVPSILLKDYFGDVLPNRVNEAKGVLSIALALDAMEQTALSLGIFGIMGELNEHSWVNRKVQSGEILSFKEEKIGTILQLLEGEDQLTVLIHDKKEFSPFDPPLVVTLAELKKMHAQKQVSSVYLYKPGDRAMLPQLRDGRAVLSKEGITLVGLEPTRPGGLLFHAMDNQNISVRLSDIQNGEGTATVTFNGLTETIPNTQFVEHLQRDVQLPDGTFLEKGSLIILAFNEAQESVLQMMFLPNGQRRTVNPKFDYNSLREIARILNLARQKDSHIIGEEGDLTTYRYRESADQTGSVIFRGSMVSEPVLASINSLRVIHTAGGLYFYGNDNQYMVEGQTGTVVRDHAMLPQADSGMLPVNRLEAFDTRSGSLDLAQLSAPVASNFARKPLIIAALAPEEGVLGENGVIQRLRERGYTVVWVGSQEALEMEQAKHLEGTYLVVDDVLLAERLAGFLDPDDLVEIRDGSPLTLLGFFGAVMGGAFIGGSLAWRYYHRDRAMLNLTSAYPLTTKNPAASFMFPEGISNVDWAMGEVFTGNKVTISNGQSLFINWEHISNSKLQFDGLPRGVGQTARKSSIEFRRDAQHIVVTAYTQASGEKNPGPLSQILYFKPGRPSGVSYFGLPKAGASRAAAIFTDNPDDLEKVYMSFQATEKGDLQMTYSLDERAAMVSLTGQDAESREMGTFFSSPELLNIKPIMEVMALLRTNRIYAFRVDIRDEQVIVITTNKAIGITQLTLKKAVESFLQRAIVDAGRFFPNISDVVIEVKKDKAMLPEETDQAMANASAELPGSIIRESLFLRMVYLAQTLRLMILGQGVRLALNQRNIPVNAKTGQLSKRKILNQFDNSVYLNFNKEQKEGQFRIVNNKGDVKLKPLEFSLKLEKGKITLYDSDKKAVHAFDDEELRVFDYSPAQHGKNWITLSFVKEEEEDALTIYLLKGDNLLLLSDMAMLPLGINRAVFDENAKYIIDNDGNLTRDSDLAMVDDTQLEGLSFKEIHNKMNSLGREGLIKAYLAIHNQGWLKININGRGRDDYNVTVFQVLKNIITYRLVSEHIVPLLEKAAEKGEMDIHGVNVTLTKEVAQEDHDRRIYFLQINANQEELRQNLVSYDSGAGERTDAYNGAPNIFTMLASNVLVSEDGLYFYNNHVSADKGPVKAFKIDLDGNISAVDREAIVQKSKLDVDSAMMARRFDRSVDVYEDAPMDIADAILQRLNMKTRGPINKGLRLDSTPANKLRLIQNRLGIRINQGHPEEYAPDLIRNLEAFFKPNLARAVDYGSNEVQTLQNLLNLNPDLAMTSEPEQRQIDQAKLAEYGGIDLNPALLDLQIKRDGFGIPLPLNQQPIMEMNIEGFLPVIINIIPVDLPIVLGLVDEGSGDSDLSYDTRIGPMEVRKQFKAREPESRRYS